MEYEPSGDLVQDALNYAISHHDGQTRKSTGLPFATHVSRVGQILGRYNAEDTVIAAGFLHDVVEDTGDSMDDYVTFDDVEEEFGADVADLVRAASEHTKDAPWAERKQHTVTYVQEEATDEEMQVIVADKMDNLEAFYHDIRQADDPDSVWEQFNEPDVRKQAWYYGSIADEAVDRFADTPFAGLAETYQQQVEEIFDDVNRLAP